MHQLTGSEIAASVNRTGNKALGGDWELETTTSQMNVELAIDKATLKDYSGIFTERIFWVNDDIPGIQSSEPDGTDVQTIITFSFSGDEVEVDRDGGKIYYTDGGIITKADLDGSNQEQLPTGSFSSPIELDLDGQNQEQLFELNPNNFPTATVGDLAIDTVNNNIYWTSTNGDRAIGRASLSGDGSDQAAILNGSNEANISPKGIEVDPAGGKIYWTANDFVSRANLDGTGKEVVFGNIGLPSGFDIDTVNSKLYWTNGDGDGDLSNGNQGLIQKGNFDGTGLENLVSINLSSFTRLPGLSLAVEEVENTFGFQPQVTFAAGSRPYSVAIGDLNGDSVEDLAVVNISDSTVSVLLGDGSGGFSAQTTFATGSIGSFPSSIAIGDLDGDGAANDLAVANFLDSTVSVLLGNGSGGFSASTTFAVGSRPFSIAVGDLDGDSAADDLAVTNRFDNNVSVLLGDGSGGFSTQTNFAVGGDPFSIAVGDLDGDSAADDLAVANNGDNNVSVLLGDGSGGFSTQTTFAVGGDPSSVAIGDLDGDGAADDLAVANSYDGDNNVSVLLGDGLGGFSAQTTFAVGSRPQEVAIGDLDGDGAADDLAVTNFLDSTVSVLLGDGSGGFSARTTFAVGTTPYSVAIGDLDEDGAADDLAVANYNSDNVSVLIECFLTGTRVLTQRGEVAVEDLAVGDLVQTKEGELEPVKWIGYQTIEPGSIRNTLRGNPVLVKTGALGHSLPTRDLYLSPDHSLLVDGLLINAGALVNDVSIVQTEPTDTFVYHSVELERHALLTVEGTYAESYMPHHEERLNYDNGAEYEQLYPHGSNLMLWPMDYPRVSSRTQVPHFVSEKLMKIAYQLGHTIDEMIA